MQRVRLPMNPPAGGKESIPPPRHCPGPPPASGACDVGGAEPPGQPNGSALPRMLQGATNSSAPSASAVEASVYLYYDTGPSKRLVAIKTMLVRNTAGASTQFARFLTEAGMLARVQDTNTVVVHDFGEDNGQPFMIYGIPRWRLVGGRDQGPQAVAAAGGGSGHPRGVSGARRHSQVWTHPPDVKPSNLLRSEGEGNQSR